MNKQDEIVYTSSRGLGLGTVLFIVFLVLKLTDNIDWPWVYVTMPLWVVPVAFFGIFIVLGGFTLIGGGLAWIIERVRR